MNVMKLNFFFLYFIYDPCRDIFIHTHPFLSSTRYVYLCLQYHHTLPILTLSRDYNNYIKFFFKNLQYLSVYWEDGNDNNKTKVGTCVSHTHKGIEDTVSSDGGDGRSHRKGVPSDHGWNHDMIWPGNGGLWVTVDVPLEDPRLRPVSVRLIGHARSRFVKVEV